MHGLQRIGWRSVSALTAVAGIGVAGYLTRTHYDQGALVCTVGDCRTVQESEYADVAGIPVAILGLGMYLTVLALGAIRWRRPRSHGAATLAAFAVVLAGAFVAAYLTVIELVVIDAVCQWCVVSAVLTAILLAAEGAGVREWAKSSYDVEMFHAPPRAPRHGDAS